MKFLIAAATFAFVAWTFVQHFRNRPAAGPQERFFNIRSWAFTGLVCVLFALAFIVLPNKGRVLLVVPVFLAGMSLNKWMRKTRLRLREEEAERTSFERAKRVN
jgi:hypothetical protein